MGTIKETEQRVEALQEMYELGYLNDKGKDKEFKIFLNSFLMKDGNKRTNGERSNEEKTMEEEISFKSNRENFNKELHGIKCNTFRKVDFNDKRFKKLFKMQTYEKYGIIEITCDNSCFKRQIKDITAWDGYIIISWDNPDIKKELKRKIEKISFHHMIGEGGKVCPEELIDRREIFNLL